MKKISTSLLIITITGLLAIAVVGIVLYAISANEPAAAPSQVESIPEGTATTSQPIVGENRTVEMTISDDSVSPDGIPAYKGKQLLIKATNNAKDARNLVIEKMNFSESIKAGETKEITLTVPGQTGSYEYQIVSSDGTVSARGNVIVL